MTLAALLLLPPLFVFGVYHLFIWADLFHIVRTAYWKRVALAAVVSHGLLATGFFAYLYFDYRQGLAYDTIPPGFTAFLFGPSDFRWVTWLLDTAAMAAVLGFFSLVDRAGFEPPAPVAWTFAIVYLVGSLQWYVLGGAVGAVIGRFWAAMKTGDDDEWLSE